MALHLSYINLNRLFRSVALLPLCQDVHSLLSSNRLPSSDNQVKVTQEKPEGHRSVIYFASIDLNMNKLSQVEPLYSVCKIHPPAVIIAAIQAITPHSRHFPGAGDHTTPHHLLALSIQAQRQPTLRQTGWPDALTEREREVINLAQQGLSNKDIAHQLSISGSMVRHHLTSIFDKVGVPNRQKLMVHAHQLHTLSNRLPA